MKNIRIYPSLISADQLNLHAAITNLEQFCDGFHLDIMDNHFVPNLTWGPPTANAIARVTTKKLWFHLMVDAPERMIPQLATRPKDSISFHIETTNKIKETISLIREKNCTTSVAINPKTALEKILPFTDHIDQILIMSVEPGFSGQQFLGSTYERLTALVTHKKESGYSYTIGVDGGITADILAKLIEHGATDFAIASAIFSAQNPHEALERLYRAAEKN